MWSQAKSLRAAAAVAASHSGAQGGVRRQYAVVAVAVHAWERHQRGDLADQFERGVNAVERGGQPVVAPARSAGLVDADQPIAAIGLSGRLPNADTWIRRGGKVLPTGQARIRVPNPDDD